LNFLLRMYQRFHSNLLIYSFFVREIANFKWREWERRHAASRAPFPIYRLLLFSTVREVKRILSRGPSFIRRRPVSEAGAKNIAFIESSERGSKNIDVGLGCGSSSCSSPRSGSSCSRSSSIYFFLVSVCWGAKNLRRERLRTNWYMSHFCTWIRPKDWFLSIWMNRRINEIWE